MQVVCPQWQYKVIQLIGGLIAIHYPCPTVRAVLHELVPHADAHLLGRATVLVGDQLDLISGSLVEEEVQLGGLKAQVRGQGQRALLVPVWG